MNALDNAPNIPNQTPSANQIDQSLRPKDEKHRTVSATNYIFMWIGDGVNLGNMSLGASLVVAGAVTMNIFQAFMAAIIAIGITSVVFALNDRLGYRTGIPYVVQLRMSFGIQGSVISSLLRGIPAIVWYGFQSWIGGTALNEIIKVFSGNAFDNVFVCFLALQAVQIGLSLYGFHAVKWVETVVSIVIMSALLYVFYLLLTEHHAVIAEKWVHAKWSGDLVFFGFIMAFLGNYATIFLSAADYSRELKTGMSDFKRGFLYFFPILLAYGFVLAIGAMLAIVTGNTNLVKAFAIVVHNDYITVVVSSFIVLGVIAVNMVANIIPPTYVITLLTKLKYKFAVVITGLLAICSFPWLLVQDSSAQGLRLFVLTYSAFLGPVVSILLIEYYILRKQQIDIKELYKTDGQFAGSNPAALIAILVGAGFAFLEVNLGWIVGFVIGGLTYYCLMRFAFLDSPFRKGTIFDSK